MTIGTYRFYFSLVALICLLLTQLGSAGVAQAHSVELVKSDPADGAVLQKLPPLITAKFSEEIESGVSTMKLNDASGRQVDSGGNKLDLDDLDHVTLLLPLPTTLPAGVYTVIWHVVLVDGDTTDGQFSFRFGTGAPVDRPAPILQKVLIAGALPLLGSGAGVTVLAVAVALGAVVSVFIARRRNRAKSSS